MWVIPCLLDIVLGIVGAMIGGFIFNSLAEPGVTGVNIWSFVVATVGAIILLVLCHAFAGRPSFARLENPAALAAGRTLTCV
jgi:uncharacterized membrane protein YeaQ/YmgE (transglycosylase-associated protein family)